MKYLLVFSLMLTVGCYHAQSSQETLSLIQIQDRNGITETVSHPDRLASYESVDFNTSQPYKKVLRVYKSDGKNHSRITTYHPNGGLWQYLEIEEMRAYGAYREWFPNGIQKIEAKVIGGTADVALGSQQDWLFDGINQVWDDQGNVVAKISYEKGSLQGPSLYYYPSGQLQRELSFLKGNLNGEAVEYNLNGQVKSQTRYKDGHQEGKSEGFFNDGKLAWDETYSDGLLLEGTYYNPKGDPISKIEKGGGYQALYEGDALTFIEFRMGRPEGQVQKYTASGEIYKIFHTKNGRKQGEEIEYFLRAQLDPATDFSKPVPKLSVNWNENTIQGKVKTWYNNGQLHSQRDYTRNQKTGPSIAWYRDGTLMMMEEYEEDRLVSGQYFKTNKREPVSTIINGNGLATLFDENGVFLKKISYSKGKVVEPEN